MRHPVKRIIFAFAVLGLFACSGNSPAAIPEWKSVYFQLMKTALSEDTNHGGVEAHYGIQLYDLDSDGIPELLERYPRATQPDYLKIWFIADGMAKHLLFKYPTALKWEDIEYVTGMHINHNTGALLAEKIYAHHQFESYEYFTPDKSGEIWNMVAAVGFAHPYPESAMEYEYIDSDGIQQEISEWEYNQYTEQILNGYSHLKEEFFHLASYSPWSVESAKVISDYFDSYDGIPSMVYKQA